MKILSYQPFSLFANGGGNRILRRLYQGKEAKVVSLVIDGFSSVLPNGNIKETLVPAMPVHRPWMRWRLRNLGMWLRDVFFHGLTTRRIRKAARQMDYEVIHVVDHGPYCAALCVDEFLEGKQLWVSFHDHFNTTKSNAENTRRLWQHATRRLVISEEIAAAYSRLFGEAQYEIITDGVEAQEIRQPSAQIGVPINIYFAGLLHLHYIPLFKTLADALDRLSNDGLQFKLVLRGTQQLNELNDRQFEVDYRPVTLNNADLKAELDAADILYLPIKFTTPDFYLYSLSTKMVGYLGAPGAILYHGPADSAACHLLKNNQAAICCGALDTDDLVASLRALLSSGEQVSIRAKELARNRFDLKTIQQRFWAGDLTGVDR
ncbi:hypothetical protein C8P68_102171 [Mucilaginibacter yixingensis]|uniref:Glycosyltransferase involved in cell wall biosynthesis n=1 Tax=Mucilaginibacter yixingensis TaxID=1295612 RepID=A0A2T5JCG3_9SPHI|nr:glycosyltransferase [Mucilaginibacter yixingensis]PTQ99355.1 hypothetical protein C8P68_102171 [Mucilaginibacter yixingensis]